METNPNPIRLIHNFIFYSNDYESTFSVITYSFHRFHFGGHNIPQVLQFVAIPNWLHGKAQLLAVNRSSLALTGHLSQTALGEVAVELGVDLPLLPLVQLLEVIHLELGGLRSFLGSRLQSPPGVIRIVLDAKVGMLAVNCVQRA